MKLNWHKATEITPPRSGVYCVICKFKNGDYINGDNIMVNVDYYYRRFNIWVRCSEFKNGEILYWAELDHPNVPEELSDKINYWFWRN